ncbi:MAG: hypothetical protein R2864_09895 [Syntrophotaleaceae bacterium]
MRVGKVLDMDRDEINADRETILDTCGTGGGGTRSFNISTTVAFVVAACGVKVAKQRRSVSSACSSAGVLERLGVNLDITVWPRLSPVLIVLRSVFCSHRLCTVPCDAIGPRAGKSAFAPSLISSAH